VGAEFRARADGAAGAGAPRGVIVEECQRYLRDGEGWERS